MAELRLAMPTPSPSLQGGSQQQPLSPLLKQGGTESTKRAAGSFKAQLPPDTKPGQVLQVMVPAGYPQAGQMAKFQVPEGVQPGDYVMVPLPPKKHRASGLPGAEIEIPPGTFAVILPPTDVAGTIMEVPVPDGYPQAGWPAKFQVPPDAKPGGLVYVPLPDADYSDDSKAYEKKFASKHSGASTSSQQSSTAGDTENGVLAALRQMRKALINEDGTMVDLLRKEPAEKTSLGIFVKNQQIIGVIAGSFADGKLKIGDRIDRVNGKDVSDGEDCAVKELKVSRDAIGTQIEISYTRGQEQFETVLARQRVEEVEACNRYQNTIKDHSRHLERVNADAALVQSFKNIENEEAQHNQRYTRREMELCQGLHRLQVHLLTLIDAAEAAATAVVQPKGTAIDTSASQDIDNALSKLEENARLATQRRREAHSELQMYVDSLKDELQRSARKSARDSPRDVDSECCVSPLLAHVSRARDLPTP